MRPPFIVVASVALAAPVLAQPASGRTDWTKPVTGVDAPVPAASAEDRTLSVTVELTSAKANRDGFGPPLLPPCEPPVTNTEAAKPPPAPCPLPPR